MSCAPVPGKARCKLPGCNWPACQHTARVFIAVDPASKDGDVAVKAHYRILPGGQLLFERLEYL